MSEIDIVEDEARRQDHQAALERGDQRCDYKITLQSTTRRFFRRPLTFSDEGYILIQKDWTTKQIIVAVIDAISRSFELQDNYEAMEFRYVVQPYGQTNGTES